MSSKSEILEYLYKSYLGYGLLCASLLMSSLAIAQCGNTTVNGYQENLLQATFHSALYKTADGYAASGSSTAPDGSSQPNIQLLSNANGYTGIPATTTISWGTIGGNAQLLLLGDDGIMYVGGDEGVVLDESVTSGSTYAPTAVGLPAGVGLGDIQKFQATNEVVMIHTTAGEIFITGKSTDNIMTPSSSTAWNNVPMPLGVSAVMVDISAKTLFVYGSDGNFYTRGARMFTGSGTASTDITVTWIIMMAPPLSPGSIPVQIELANHEHYNQVGYLILDADGTIHSLGDAPVVANNSNSSQSWTKVGLNCPNGELQNVVYLSASDNDNRHVGAGAILADKTIMLWGVDDFNMLAGADSECPTEVCVGPSSDMSSILYIENGTHLTPAINAAGQLCNVGHNSEGGFGDGTTDNRSCYECYSVPSLPNLCVDGSCDMDTTIVASICGGQTYSELNLDYTQTGIYTEVLTSSIGCDSVVTLELTVMPVDTIRRDVSICPGQSYFEGTSEYTTTGVYQDIYNSSTGCDSVIVTTLNVGALIAYTNEVDLCEGETHSEGSSVYTDTGTYEDSYISSAGCDSTVTTILNVHPAQTVTNQVSICAGQSFTEGSSTYTTTGIYEDVYQSVYGCDSTVVTELTVVDQLSSTQELSICQGSSLTVQGIVYTSSGTYSNTFITANGCDSLVITELTVLDQLSSTQEIVICQGSSYTVQSSVYTESGTYTDTFTTSAGCDSLVTTELIVVDDFSSTQELSICYGDSYTVQDSVYTESGTYTNTFLTATGCDSLVTTILTVFPSSSSIQELTICTGDSYEVGSSVYINSGEYTDLLQNSVGCDSLVTTYLTVISPPEVSLSQDDVLSCDSVTVALENGVLAGDEWTYTWDLGDGTSSSETAITHTYTLPGTYLVSLTLSNGNCQAVLDEPLIITINELPSASFTASTWETEIGMNAIDFFDESIGSIVTYDWSFGDGSMGMGTSVSHLYQEVGVYEVELAIADDAGCTDTISNTVVVDYNGYDILVPNAFIPDPNGPGDGSFNADTGNNSVFFPYSENATGMEFYVFNRWGEQIFKSTSLTKGWDGYFQGQPCPLAVYSYRVVFSYPHGQEKEKIGTVTLFR